MMKRISALLLVLCMMLSVVPAMAEAVGACRARKFLVPMNSCGVMVAGVKEQSLSSYVTQAVDELLKHLGEG